MKISLIFLSYGLKPRWLLYIFMFWIFNKVKNNFSWSLPLSTIKVTSKCANSNGTRGCGWVVSLRSFEHFEVGSFLWKIYFTITLTVIDVHFRWNLSGNYVCEKKNKLCHHHIIFMVCTLINRSSWPISARNPYVRFWWNILFIVLLVNRSFPVHLIIPML